MKNSILSLSREQKQIYNSILFAVSHGKTEFSIPNNSDMKMVSNLVKIVLGENSEYFYYDNCQINYFSKGFKKIVKLTKWLNTLSVKLYIDKFNAQSRNIINEVVTSDMNEIQKVLALHNYLVKNISYFGGIKGFGKYQHYHTAYGAIVDKCAVCEGIAAAYCYLLSLVGINSTVVNGKTENSKDYDHAWNIVELDGKFFHIDVTWDLKNKNDDVFPCLDYFSLKDSDLKNRTWNKYMYPSCNFDDMNFFRLTKSVANSDSELIKIAIRQASHSNGLYLKCPYLSYLKKDAEYCDYILNIIDSNSILRSLLQGKLVFRANLEQSIICVGKNQN